MTNVSSVDLFRTDTKQAALDYNSNNPTHFLFPIKALSKFPLLVQDLAGNASNDPKQIEAWAAKWKNCNWGVALKKSRLMVADVDTKSGKFGQATFDLLDLMYGWPQTKRVVTPSGGFHLYFDAAEHGHIFALGRHGFGPDIDSPNYVLIAGSVTKSGSYVAGNACAAVKAPQWFYDVLRAAKTKIERVDDIVVDLDKPENIAWTKDYLKEDAEPAVEGKNGDHTTLRVAMSVKDQGISRDLAIELMLEHYNPRCAPPWEAEALTRKVDNAYAYAKHSKAGGKTAEADFTSEGDEINPNEIKVQGDTATIAKEAAQREAAKEEPKPKKLGERPQVQILPGRLPEAMDQTQAILVKQAQRFKNKNGGSTADEQIFQREGHLVRLNRNLHTKLQKVPGSTKSRTVPDDTKTIDSVVVDQQYQEQNALTILPVTAPWLTTRLSRSIDYVGRSAGKPGAKPALKSRDVSQPLVHQLLSETKTQFPALFSTIEAPTLRADGSILDAPGYDPKSGIFLDPGETVFPKIKANPTADEGRAAINYLNEELLGSFPFVDEDGYEGTSRSVALAMLLTGPVRRGLKIAPAFAADSNEPESGKSMLLKAAGALMTGRAIAGRPFSESEEERRKALGTAFSEARPVLFFDNVDCVIEGASLEMALTTPLFEDRKLGKHEGIAAPTNALTLFSANHISVGGDGMTTRVLVARIVPAKKLSERLADNEFRHPDLIEWIIENRPALIAAVLTALRAFIIHGQASAKPTISRFPEWGSLIGNALIWYGFPDPTRGGDVLRDADPVKEAMRTVVQQWRHHFKLDPVSAADLAGSPAMREAIGAAKGLRQGDVSAHAVSGYVKKMIGVGLDLPYTVAAIPQPPGRRYATRWHLVLTDIAEDAEPESHGDGDDGGPDDGIEDEVAEVEAAGIAEDEFMRDPAEVQDTFADLM